jgi:nicotinamidase-related amidase
VNDAADHAYKVTCLTDACQAETMEPRQASLGYFRGYAAQTTVDSFAATLTP